MEESKLEKGKEMLKTAGSTANGVLDKASKDPDAIMNKFLMVVFIIVFIVIAIKVIWNLF